ncbi:ATP-binding protein [Acidiferrimicrobium sp. IK]|uniref:ATP-binding protein n=1 Tax=Acidiferrimicrobium sp. IK TaxID=2871700 RepID=UPI0021CB611B|nr:ATP-binding protein [Acidiferrimicrobium sp. IK]MCU4187528.1 ATP-binding protein [Acidiferrimicrobium sp. IK]
MVVAGGGSDAELRALARNLSAVLDELHLLVPPRVEDGLADRLQAHLNVDARTLPVINQEFPSYQLVDVNVALEAWPAAAGGRRVEVIGVSGDQRRFHPLSELLSSGRMFGVGVGPVDYHDLADSPDTTRSCVQFGIFLLWDGERRAAALVRGADPHGPIRQAMVELVADDPTWAREVLAELRALAVERSVLRGQVLALGVGEGQQYGGLRFMPRPTLSRDELVLPEATLSQIERHVVGIAEHGPRLRAAGQHLKRGVLLYGPVGCG